MTAKLPQIKLYGISASRVMRALWMLDELRSPGGPLQGLQYEHDPISYADPALAAPPYSTLNPNGRVPILVVDGFVIYESLAINLYLADKFESALTLKTAEERALGNQWALWAMTELELPVMDWAMHSYLKPEAERDAKVASAALQKLARPLAALNASLVGKNYVVGDRFTVADLNTACVMYRLLKLDMAAWPHAAAWLQRCWAREAAKPARRARGELI
jgi:glutathione S-transferase